MDRQRQQEVLIKFVMISGLFICPLAFVIFFTTLSKRWYGGEVLSENLAHPIFVFIMAVAVVAFIIDVHFCKKHYGWFEWVSFSGKNKRNN